MLLFQDWNKKVLLLVLIKSNTNAKLAPLPEVIGGAPAPPGAAIASPKKIWGCNKNLLRPLVVLAFFVYH